ncbi:MAG: glycerol-3-phosphate 1-O-acyltransferase PlsY [Acidimicrobiia bacterium]|nr:glycerol-3-phosphate 1-O-acyltransferase PlsY [Acidimicrobiia bacterium]
MIQGAIAVVLSYLIGSIDFAVVVGRMHGVNIHDIGSGNPGASNVMRTLGKGPAVMVFVGDALKGVIAAAMGTFLTGAQTPISAWAYAAGLGAVTGHCYPLYHRFKGGKGVATGGGVVFFTLPLVGLILTMVWLLLARLTKVASIASLIVVVTTIPLAVWQGVSGTALAALGAILLLVIYRHRGNISRILNRAEQKVTP